MVLGSYCEAYLVPAFHLYESAINSEVPLPRNELKRKSVSFDSDIRQHHRPQIYQNYRINGCIL